MMFNGKSLYENKVCLESYKLKYSVIFIFENAKEARNYYEKFNYQTNSLFFKRMKVAFCKHENEYSLDIGSKRHHYNYCPNCCRAIFVDDETDEQKEQRMKELDYIIKVDKAKELKDEICNLERNLSIKKKNLNDLENQITESEFHKKIDI